MNANADRSASADLENIKELRQATGAPWQDCKDAYRQAVEHGSDRFSTVMDIAREITYVKARLRWEDLKSRGKI